MEFRELKTFCVVVEQESFSKAGQAVHLSQPTVSLHIKALEDELNVKLFDRLDRKVILTAAGQILYQYAKEILARIDHVKAALCESSGQKVYGKITIGAGVTIGEGTMPQSLGLFKKKYPLIEISLKILDTSAIIKQMLSYKLDMGIIGANIHHNNLTLEKFTADSLILIVHPSHPFAARKEITLLELFEEPIIVREDGSGTRMSICNEFNKRGLNESDMNVIMELGSTGAIKQAVLANYGVAFVNQQAVQNELKSGLLKKVPVKDFDLKKEFYLVLHQKKTKSKILETFLRFLEMT
jgi:DNA-binding transcriptional LysR family regulator